jgi:hypothetical protein
MRARLQEIKEGLRRQMHWPIPETGKWLGQIVAGYFAYHAVPTNSAAISAFRYHVIILWHRRLRRRSQRTRLVWTQMAKLADEFLPKPRILHPWPSVRFAVRHRVGRVLGGLARSVRRQQRASLPQRPDSSGAREPPIGESYSRQSDCSNPR